MTTIMNQGTVVLQIRTMEEKLDANADWLISGLINLEREIEDEEFDWAAYRLESLLQYTRNLIELNRLIRREGEFARG